MPGLKHKQNHYQKERKLENAGLSKDAKLLKYTTNEYELQSDGQMVYDRATDLMWQQSGSEVNEGYSGYLYIHILKLNDENFGGYSDWRLPTLEEAKSLLEPEKRGNNLFIDPMFDSKQRHIWTSDTYNESYFWVVNFSSGRCSNSSFTSGSYIRAVRWGQ